ncbi:MAG: hypothetical protein KJN63_05075 [Acidimicrobiia bacterium]|nr:hypothetical protein [Acidimicrobiia bacterium]
MTDVALGADGLVYASAQVGVAALDPEAGDWTVLDIEGLPRGAPADELWPARSISQVATGPDGSLWLAGWAHSYVDDEDFGGVVSAWSPDSRMLSWVAQQECIADGCSWAVFTSDDTPELNQIGDEAAWPTDIGDIAIDSDGTLYASLGENLLAVHGQAGWEAHTVPGLSEGWGGGVSPWSSSLAVDRDGAVWAGTNDPGPGRGLVIFDGDDFKRLTAEDGLPGDNVFQVSAAGDGTIWVATDVLYADPATASPDAAAGIARFDGIGWTTYTIDDGLLTNDGIVAAGPDGTAWVLHNEIAEKGYSRFDGAEWMAESSDPPVGGFRAAVDENGTLWTTTDAGLIAFDGSTKVVYPSPFRPDVGGDDEPVFSFAEHDLSEWVSEDEVAEFVAAEFDWNGTATKVNGYEDAAGHWELSSADGPSGSVIVVDGGLSEDFDGNPYNFDLRMERQGALDYQGPVCVGDFVAGHPALSDGVVVHNGGFGQFTFAVPPDTEWLLLFLDVPGRTDDDWTSCEGSITTGGVASEDYEPRFFAVADHFLEELGWLPDQ